VHAAGGGRKCHRVATANVLRELFFECLIFRSGGDPAGTQYLFNGCNFFIADTRAREGEKRLTHEHLITNNQKKTNSPGRIQSQRRRKNYLCINKLLKRLTVGVRLTFVASRGSLNGADTGSVGIKVMPVFVKGT
jgi:hypothetical protein